MATLMSTQEEDERNLQQQMEMMAPTLSDGVSGGAGGGGAMGAPSMSQPRMSSGRGGGGGFVNVQQYVDANRGATQRLGESVAGTIRGAGDQARSAIDQGSQQFGQMVDAGTVRLTDSLRNRISSDPSGIAGTPDALAAVTRARDAEYQGPRDLESTEMFGGIADAVRGARDTGELAGSASGISQLADRSVQGSRTAGGRSFDTTLLRGDEGSRNRIESEREGLSDISGRLESASDQARDRAQQGMRDTKRTGQETRTAIRSARQDLQGAINERLNITRQQAIQRAQQAKAALQPISQVIPTTGQQGGFDPVAPDVIPSAIRDFGGHSLDGFQRYLGEREGFRQAPSAAVLEDLGISAQEFDQLTDLEQIYPAVAPQLANSRTANPYFRLGEFERLAGDIGDYVTMQNPQAAITRGNVATADDYARHSALDMLAGDSLGFLDPTQAKQAGTASTDLIDFDRAGLEEQRGFALKAIREDADTVARLKAQREREKGRERSTLSRAAFDPFNLVT